MSGYIVLKQENITSIKDLESYDYFIVHAISEFRIYSRKDFLEKYATFDEIFNLYCIKTEEELRYNNQNWVKIFEKTQKNEYENAFEILQREKKDFIPIKEDTSISVPIVVYKYFVKPETIVHKNGYKEVIYIKDIPFIYRHAIAN